MTKKIFTLVAVLILISIASACSQTKDKKNQTAESMVEQTEKKIGNTAGIKVPSDLKQITADMAQEFKKANCSNEAMSDICDYYIQTKNNGDKSTKNLQWNSLCAYVKKYGEDKKFTTGSYDYETLGYEEKACRQGMYQK